MVYVINKNGKPLMPCSDAKAHHLMDSGKAKCVRRTVFTIKLLWDCEENVQEVVGGMDTGSKKIGCAAIGNGRVLYQSEIEIRNDVRKKMERRKMYRRTRRNRKTRYREPRWKNRSSMRKGGRIPPSIKSKVDSHIREKEFVESILPISFWNVETAKFDIHKIQNPNVGGIEYQNGNQKDYYNVKAYVLNRDNYQCQKCKKKKVPFNVHHIIYRSKGGTDVPSNLITLCKECHADLHEGKIEIKKTRSKTKHATHENIICSKLKEVWDFVETFGYETKYKREIVLELSKTHYNDAVSICCSDNDKIINNNNVFYKKNVSGGDYQQSKGIRSEIKIPTGKLFGFRKFDLVKTQKGIGFVKGKRSSGRFVICDIFWKILEEPNIKKNCIRLRARKTTLIKEVVVK